MRVFVRTYAVIVAIIALLMTTHAAPDRCIDCLRAQYCAIAPDDWTKSGPPSFPESRTMSTQHEDFGIAFSGGGTRSASASIGELRGLKKNGWLDKVRYVAAVSGGSWAAIPFTYWPDATHARRGEPHDPTQLTYQDVLDVANGRLAAIVAQSQIVGPSFREIAGYYRAANFDPTFNAGIEAILGGVG